MTEENHEGATNQRPSTPKCIESSQLNGEVVEAVDSKHDTDKGLGPDIGLCPSCARDISVCNAIEYKVSRKRTGGCLLSLVVMSLPCSVLPLINPCRVLAACVELRGR